MNHAERNNTVSLRIHAVSILCANIQWRGHSYENVIKRMHCTQCFESFEVLHLVITCYREYYSRQVTLKAHYKTNVSNANMRSTQLKEEGK